VVSYYSSSSASKAATGKEKVILKDKRKRGQTVLYAHPRLISGGDQLSARVSYRAFCETFPCAGSPPGTRMGMMR